MRESAVATVLTRACVAEGVAKLLALAAASQRVLRAVEKSAILFETAISAVAKIKAFLRFVTHLLQTMCVQISSSKRYKKYLATTEPSSHQNKNESKTKLQQKMARPRKRLARNCCGETVQPVLVFKFEGQPKQKQGHDRQTCLDRRPDSTGRVGTRHNTSLFSGFLFGSFFVLI